jgi:hypothetical protein
MHASTLVADKLPRLASTVTLGVERSAVNSVAVLLFGSSSVYVPFIETQVLLAGFPLYFLPVLSTDAQGKTALSLPIPDDTNLLASTAITRAQQSAAVVELSEGLAGAVYRHKDAPLSVCPILRAPRNWLVGGLVRCWVSPR